MATLPPSLVDTKGSKYAPFFYTFLFFILWQGAWRPFSSSGLPRPFFACDLSIGPRQSPATTAVPVPEPSTKPPTAPLMPYTDLMKQTKMTHDELIASVMAEYTAKVNREEAYRQAVRRGEIAPPQVQSTNWNISDRH